MYESLVGLKSSLIGTRFEAIYRARQNLSLISNSGKRIQFGSNSLVFSDAAIEQIEYNRPVEEPKSNTNKSSPMSS